LLAREPYTIDYQITLLDGIFDVGCFQQVGCLSLYFSIWETPFEMLQAAGGHPESLDMLLEMAGKKYTYGPSGPQNHSLPKGRFIHFHFLQCGTRFSLLLWIEVA
jgi:hypothetical protein